VRFTTTYTVLLQWIRIDLCAQGQTGPALSVTRFHSREWQTAIAIRKKSTAYTHYDVAILYVGIQTR